MNRLLRSSAVTWAVGYVLVGIAALAAFAVSLWYAWTVTIGESRADLLRDDEQRMSEVFRREGAAGLADFIEARIAMRIPGERILLFTDASFQRLAGNVDAWPAGLGESTRPDAIEIRFDGHSIPVVLVHATLPGGYHLLVGRDNTRFLPLERRFSSSLAVAVLFLALFGVGGGILIRRELLAKVDNIRQTVAAIMQGNLSHRLPVRRSADELDTLSQTINGMLDHIEHLIRGISGVSNSIAHDLRTPLAELRSRLEMLSLTRPSPAETFAEVEGAVADVDRVIGVFNALLRLAEIDTGSRRSGFVRVDAAAVAAEMVEFYEPAAELKGIAVSCRSSGPTPVAGDPVLLAQALSNLIDNALKFGAPAGRINVTVGTRVDGTVEIVVADNGPGISAADRPNATERFFRGDASRGTPGVGLGLSIVDAVARLHGGSLELLDNEPGLRAVVLLPAAPALLAPDRDPTAANAGTAPASKTRSAA